MKALVNGLVRRNKISISGNSHTIQISPDARAALKKCTISVKGTNNTLIIEKGARISHAIIRVHGHGSRIHIGKDVYFRKGKIYTIQGEHAEIQIQAKTTVEGAYLLCDPGHKIVIGEDCMLSTDIMIRTGDKHPIYDPATDHLINEARDIVIGNHVWIGRDAMILKGVNIRSGCVIGTRSLVTRVAHEENSILAGVPAKVVKTNIRWERE